MNHKGIEIRIILINFFRGKAKQVKEQTSDTIGDDVTARFISEQLVLIPEDCIEEFWHPVPIDFLIQFRGKFFDHLL